MWRNVSTFEAKSSFCQHEAVMDYVLRMVAHLYGTITNYNRSLTGEEAERNMILFSDGEGQVMYSEPLYEKIMKEDYSFNSYKALKRLVHEVCFQNEVISVFLIGIVLKNLAFHQDIFISFLEALKEMVFIKDQFAGIRKDLIFGVPSIFTEIDFQKNLKFGLQVNKSLERVSVDFISTLKINQNSQSFLRSLAGASEFDEPRCYIMIVYLLQMLCNDEDLFKTFVKMPSPTHLYENYYDFIFGFVKIFEEKEKRFWANEFRATKLYQPIMKEKLTFFEENIRK